MLIDERLKLQLIALFPDGKVSKFKDKNLTLYLEVRNNAKKRGISITDYLSHLGFQNVREKHGKSYEDKLEKILSELNSTFPDKLISNFNNAPNNPQKKLAASLYYFCNEFKIDKNQFLLDHGFRNVNRIINTQNSDLPPYQVDTNILVLNSTNYKYDSRTIKTLCLDYGLNQIFLSELFGVSKQAISHLVNRESKHSNNWVVEKMESSILNVFNDMIINFETQFNTENKFYFIGLNKSLTKPKFVFFFAFKFDSKILCQVLFKIPDEIYEKLKSGNYHIFNSNTLKTIKQLMYKQSEYHIKGEEYYLTKNELTSIKSIIRKHTNIFPDFLSLKKYFNLNNLQEKKNTQEEKYYNLLESYYNPELDIVNIPSKGPHQRNYIKVHRAAKKRGLTFEEFIESFGFKYKRIANIDVNKRKQNYFELLEPYILGDGKIYLSSFDPIYTRFYISAYKKNKTLTAYLKDEFNLERYIHINDVPANLKPKIEKVTYTESRKESLIESINENFLLDEELYTIYIPTTSSFYLSLYRYCDSLDKTIDEIVESWGYIRLKKHEIKFYDFDEQHNEKILDSLSNIQNEINTETVETRRNKRSQRLVNLLKELYDYQCQICGEETNIPVINMSNGRNYVEVHHIVPLHNQAFFDDESTYTLDNYKNAIVVCPHHHKVLHYEKGGGYEKIVLKNGVLHFSNSLNFIEIKKNFHLNEN